MCLIPLAHLLPTNLNPTQYLKTYITGKKCREGGVQIIKVFLHIYVDFRENMPIRRCSLFLSTILLLSLPSFYGGKCFPKQIWSNFLNSALYLAMRKAATVVKSPQPKNIFEVSLFENVFHWKSIGNHKGGKQVNRTQ